MSNSHNYIRAIDNVVLKGSKVGSQVVHESEVAFNHANDSFLQDIKGLKGANNHSILKVSGAGDQVVPITSADFFDGYQSDLFTTADTRYLQSADEFVKSVAGGSKLSVTAGAIDVDLTDYAQSADLADYLKKDGSVAMTGDLVMGTNKINLNNHFLAENLGYLTYDDMVVACQNTEINMGGNILSDCGGVWFHSTGAPDANELKVDNVNRLTYQGNAILNDNNYSSTLDSRYLQSADEFVKSIVVGSKLTITSGALDVDLTDYQPTASLDTDVGALGYIKIGDVPVVPPAYIQSVDAPLAVDGSGKLTVDLSSYVQSSTLSDYVAKNEADIVLQSSFTLNSSSGDSKEIKYVWDVSAVSSSNTLQTVSIASNKVYEISAKFVVKGAAGYGVVEKKGLYRLNSGSAVLISDTDNSSVSGACDGSELLVALSSSNVNINVNTSTPMGASVNGCVTVSIISC